MSSTSPPWGSLKSLLFLSFVLIIVPYTAIRQHFAIPEPLTHLKDPLSSLPQLSESRILEHVRFLSEGIGYRIVGTREHALADEWMFDQAQTFKKQCEAVVRKETGRKLECEVWRQQGNGSHRFDMMGKRLYKTYVDITNIIVRVSDGTPTSKDHAVLVNSHLDSTLPSPGAADDALGVGVMLECMRVLIETPGWSPSNSIIFLFNNAEESLQDGSHLFSTQHPIRHTVRAVINLEAAGTTGRELLFQATSEQMIQAYAQVPRPFGTVFANDIFSSGVLLSDTDFRQFEQYLGVTGLDMAVVGNSYLYHMRKDVVENIQPGTAQHMAENILALLTHLSSQSSPIPSLTSGYTKPSTVFYSHIGGFWKYSFGTANAMHLGLFLAAITLAIFDSHATLHEQLKAAGLVLAGIIGALVGSNTVAFLMHRILGKGMSWFSNEFSALGLFAPPTLCGALLSQLILPPIKEHTMFLSLLLLQCLGAFALQVIGMGSAGIFFLSAAPLFVGIAMNDLALGGNGRDKGRVSLVTYAIGQSSALYTGTLLIVGVLEFFVPLTGRIGASAPADHIIASIIAVMGAHSLPLSLPFAQRIGRRALRRAVGGLGVLSVLMVFVFAWREPFDSMHQKRVFILHSENVTTHERSLLIAAADGAPGFPQLVNDITVAFGTPGIEAPKAQVMDDYNANWDPLYPFSAFLSPYKFALPTDESRAPWGADPAETFEIRAVDDWVDEEAGTRSLTLEIYHPGTIWTVVAFDAHVLEWTLDSNPPDEHARHHVKEGSFYGSDTWSFSLVLRHDPSSPGLHVNYIGIQERAMWPAKKREKDAPGGHRLAMGLFERLDEWLDVKTGGSVDALLLGCVGGVQVV